MTCYASIAERWVRYNTEGDAVGRRAPYEGQGWHLSRVFTRRDEEHRLWSYGTHFEIGRFMADGWVLLNGERASVTTTRHQAHVRDALRKYDVPHTIIPFGALDAAEIIYDSIEIIHDEGDRWIESVKESPRPPRHAQYVSGPELRRVEWTPEERERWQLWADHDQHQRSIASARASVDQHHEWEQRDIAAGKEDSHWIGSTERACRHVLQLLGDGPRISSYAGSPTAQRYEPTGRRIEAWVDTRKHYSPTVSGLTHDLERIEGVQQGLAITGPDDDGVWRWTVRRHILGESLIRADVRATRRMTCKECEGDGIDRTGMLPHADRAKHPYEDSHEYRVRWDAEPRVIYTRTVPVPRTDVRTTPDPDDRWSYDPDRAARSYRWDTNARRRHDFVYLGALPLPADAYPCKGCAGRGWNAKQVRRRNVMFLSGFDHGEPHLAYFFCEMPKGCTATTVDEAYEALRPEAVKLAEADGRIVKRQGDIFAIPVKVDTRELKKQAKRHAKRTPAGMARIMGVSLDDAMDRWNNGDAADLRRINERCRNARLLRSNHEATEVIVTRDNQVFARGCLYHVPDGRSNDHVRVTLGNEWHIIVKNTVPVH